MGFEPGDPRQRRFNGYGPAECPDRRDAELDGYARELRAGGQAVVRAAVAAVSEEGRRALRAYTERAAARAVRDDDRDLLLSALVMLVVGGLDHNAVEALMALSLVDDAAVRTGGAHDELFAAAAGVVGEPGAANLRRWLAREPADRTPAAMNFEAVGDAAGFRYRWLR